MSDSSNDGANVVSALERLSRLMRAGEHAGDLNPVQWEALRYLSRANRFSNSPIAMTRYLGSTKGTVSQTIKALERKGYIAKTARGLERRSIVLALTDKGRDMLSNDPLTAFSKSVGELRGKTVRRLSKGLGALLEAELVRTEQPRFGACISCRYFRERGREGDASGPHSCMLFDAGLSDVEAQLICVEHS